MNNGGTPSKGVGGGRGGDTAAKGAVLPYCSGRKCPGLRAQLFLSWVQIPDLEVYLRSSLFRAPCLLGRPGRAGFSWSSKDRVCARRCP